MSLHITLADLHPGPVEQLAEVAVLAAILYLPADAIAARFSKSYTDKRTVVRRALLASIVVAALISVVMHVFFPPLVATRQASNETSAVAALVVYCHAQKTFYREDRYEISKLVYANPNDGRGFPDLHQLPGREDKPRRWNLIDRTMAAATSPETPKAGYWYVEITGDSQRQYDFAAEFGLCAVPARYEKSGKHTFIVDHKGEVHMIDNRAEPVRTWPTGEQLAERWTCLGDNRQGVGE